MGECDRVVRVEVIAQGPHPQGFAVKDVAAGRRAALKPDSRRPQALFRCRDGLLRGVQPLARRQQLQPRAPDVELNA